MLKVEAKKMLRITEMIEMETVRKIFDSAKKQIKDMPESFYSEESVLEALDDIQQALEERCADDSNT